MQDLISKMQANAGEAKPFGAIIKFDTPDDGVICIDGTGEKIVIDDVDRVANTTIKLSRENLEKLLRGKLNPAMAAMSGKLKVEGDMTLALKLATLI